MEACVDPLSDVLSLLQPRSYVSGGFAMDDEMAIQWPGHAGIKCYAMLSGQCWLRVESVPEAVLLTAGDCFLLPRGLPFSLATGLSQKLVDFAMVRSAWKTGQPPPEPRAVGRYLVGGHFLLTRGHADLLLRLLPPIVHIRSEGDKAAMRWSLERMGQELRDPQPGGALVAQQLAYVMLVQALRLHLAEGTSGGVGWLFALGDKHIGAALTCMHDEPGHPWTLQALAERIGMSRSVFALRFKQAAGQTPMEYLTRWRMMLAGNRLKNANESVATVAFSLGYQSESAFGKAFKRVMGCSPKQFGRGPTVAVPHGAGRELSLNDQRELATAG